MPKSNQPIEESYPTIVLQFRAEGNLPPDMSIPIGEVAMFLAQGIGMINEKEGVQCDVSFGSTNMKKYLELAEILESSGE